TKGKVIPSLMPRALWWFRWAALVTVLAGLAYFGNIVGADARNGGGSAGSVMAIFFLVWTVVWGILYACLVPGKGALDKGWVFAVISAMWVVVVCYAVFYGGGEPLPDVRAVELTKLRCYLRPTSYISGNYHRRASQTRCRLPLAHT